MFYGTPEDAAAELQRRQDKADMMAQDRAHRVDRLIMEELNSENLFTFSEIMAMIANSEDPAAVANYYRGVANTVLKMKYDTCTGCGEKHTKAEDLLRVPQDVMDDVKNMVLNMTAPEPEPEPEPLPVAEKPTNYYNGYSDLVVDMEQYDSDLAEWGLARVGLGLICLNCGKSYVSLGDRMLRPKGPDGCHGCQEKSAHG